MTNTSLRLSVFIGSRSCESILSFLHESGWWYYQIENRLKAIVCQVINNGYEIENLGHLKQRNFVYSVQALFKPLPCLACLMKRNNLYLLNAINKATTPTNERTNGSCATLMPAICSVPKHAFA
jgi:hypothetical protein